MNQSLPVRTTSLASLRKERGAVLVLFAIGMVAVLGVAGLALDASRAMLSQTRLQNTVDSAALAAAKVLSNTTSTTQASPKRRICRVDERQRPVAS